MATSYKKNNAKEMMLVKRITGRLTEKNDKWYAVLNLYTIEGKRKEKWINLNLDSKRGNKTEAGYRLGELLAKYNTGDLYLSESLTRAERERIRIANSNFADYIEEWLENYKCNVSVLTYNAYYLMVKSKISPYFRRLGLTVKEITGDEINDFYSELRKSGLSGATAQRHHSLMHLAFKQAVKRKIIPTNPCEQADRPKSHQYVGNYYNAEELKSLIGCLGDDPLRIPVILSAYYGLRRSEVLGLKWDAIDWVEGKIYIRHKIIENKMSKERIEGYDVMKNKSSYRSMPVIPYIRETLIKEKEKQEEMQRMLKKSYCKKYLEYVCVDAVGNIIEPQYLTCHFPLIIKKYGLKKIRFHDLRHSCASILLANKVPMKMIQDWLGHSDMSTTANIYSHIDYTSKIESAETMGRILSQ